MSNIVEKAQQVVDAAPSSVSLSVMIGSLLLSFLQPVAVVVTIMWGCLQIHAWVKKQWGRDFLWLDRLFKRKGK